MGRKKKEASRCCGLPPPSFRTVLLLGQTETLHDCFDILVVLIKEFGKVGTVLVREIERSLGGKFLEVGRVERFAQGEAASPLIFHGGRYRQLAP